MYRMIRVLIVDDFAETRQNIKALLQYDSDIAVVGAAGSGSEAILRVDELQPDVVLMDINMPGMDGITATEIIRKKNPEIQVVVLSVQEDQIYMRRAMLAGARDFLCKPPMPDELVAAIHRAGDLAKAEMDKLRMQIEEQELVTYDLMSRCSLYDEDLVTGKLVDEIDALISGLAHDLRSPLNIILSILSTIKTNELEYIKVIHKLWCDCVYCKWIADTFLGISLSEKINPREIQIKKAIDELIALFTFRVSSKIEIKNEVNESLLIKFDVNTINLVLLNLLLNSIESIGDRGKITISSEVSKRNTLLTINDSGPGVPVDSFPRVFQLGYTTKNLHAGIGLYVSRRLMQLQQGDLVFACQYGQSSKLFGVLIPEKNTYIYKKRFSSLRLEQLQQSEQILKAKLMKYRSYGLNNTQELQKAREFRRISTAFSLNLSHELSIIEDTVSEVIKELPPPQVEIRNSFEKIINNCAYCRLLTTNILEIGEGRTYSLKNISLINTIEYILNLVDRKMPTHLYQINWVVDPMLPDVEADDVQIKQVFMNLIKNAIDAMPSGGTLHIKLEPAGDNVSLEIGDTGIGIKSENISKLFQRGYTTKQKGYGIGLYSIKKILDRHHATIKVDSKPNKRTTFKILFPIKQPG